MSETKEYTFAKAVAKAKVELLIYDGVPHTLDIIVRAKFCIDDVEHGWEEAISPVDNISIGTAIDTALSKLPIPK